MPNFKVLLLDGIDPAGVEVIERAGSITAVVHNKIARDKLLEIVSDVDGIIVRSATAIDKELMLKAPRLKVVGRAGVGVDNVDIETATERGILVMNSPGGSTTTTAEHAIAMLFALARSIPQAYLSLKAGKWEKSKFKGVEITGKTLGVVGLGRIGSEVARKCQAMGMNVLAYDPFINPDTPLSSGFTLVSLPQIFEQADFISFHVPLTDATRNLVNKASIAGMKDGVRLINCARGGIIDEKDLCDALKSGKVAGAAFDVFNEEPNTESPLLTLDNFIATPHLGASTVEAQRKVSEDVCRQVSDYLLKNAVSGALNFPQLDLGQVESYQHFVDLAARIATFTSQISDGRLKSVSIRYSGEVCDMNLNYLTSVMVQRILVPMLREGVNLINAMHVAQLRGIKVEHTRVPTSENFTNLITFEMKTESEIHRVSGTVFNDRLPRIVNIDGFALEVIPRGHMIYFTNNDRPGVIGKIGTILGQCNVNIAGMQLGREHEGGRALALLLVDEPVRTDVIEKVLGIDNILTAKAVRV
jgi:D-3-phosphoglycerate dehydrogenase